MNLEHGKSQRTRQVPKSTLEHCGARQEVRVVRDVGGDVLHEEGEVASEAGAERSRWKPALRGLSPLDSSAVNTGGGDGPRADTCGPATRMGAGHFLGGRRGRGRRRRSVHTHKRSADALLTVVAMSGSPHFLTAQAYVFWFTIPFGVQNASSAGHARFFGTRGRCSKSQPAEPRRPRISFIVHTLSSMR